MNYSHGSKGTTRRQLSDARALPALLLTATMLLAAPAAALDSDRRQPVQLDADHAQMNNATGVGVYTGNVVMTQGTMKITADKMTIHTTPAGEVRRVIAEGDMATFRQLPEGQTEYVDARAPRMEYVMAEPATVDLTGGATLTQGKNEFSGQVINYDVSKDVVTAHGGKKADQRIRITFFPKEEGESGQQRQERSGQ